jgi:hypothetical protein
VCYKRCCLVSDALRVPYSRLWRYPFRQNFSVPRHLSLYEYGKHLLVSLSTTIVPFPEARRSRPVPPTTVYDMVKP